MGAGSQYPNPKPPLPSGQDRSASFHDRGARRTGERPGSAGIVRPCALALPPGNRARRTRPEGTGSMSLSMRAEPLAPQTIAGGIRPRPGPPDHGRLAGLPTTPPRRRRLPHLARLPRDGRQALHPRPRPGARLRARRALTAHRRLPQAGPRLRQTTRRRRAPHLVRRRHRLPRRRATPTTTPWPTPSAAGSGALAIPRRILRLLAGGARPALIATAIAVLLRCLARGRGGFKSRGRVKAAWIARTFDVDLRRVKHARAELIDLGWIVPEPDDQWAMNRWGRAYRIDLDWGPDRPPRGSAIATPSPPRWPPIATP